MATYRGTVFLKVISASDLIAADSNGKSDPYVIVQKEGENDKKKILKTKIIKKTLNPVWREEFKLTVTTQDKILFTVKDWDRFGSDDPLGTAEVIIETLLGELNTPQLLTLPLQGVKSGRLVVEIMFVEEGLESEIPSLSHTRFFKNINGKLDRDYILIVDMSWSMEGKRWKEAKKAVKILAPCICNTDPDGITLYLFESRFEKFTGIKKANNTAKKVGCFT
eukprot:CAMPEP_0168559882 /NCGR_PEP_ID=MMETSP0413-20121227/10760_1 /TAXON_ID=136452 /ORGANISM="Filamoeba nolandi, Strain NC-AS-23-1" /LENGTH=221 /DNA_ID=CAMNT_0008591139 /DNA_START=32 /DNA_END=694 /DNA_ORIENTATION=-